MFKKFLTQLNPIVSKSNKFLNELLKTTPNKEYLNDILESGKVNINQVDKDGNSFLHICILKSKSKSALILIKHKIDTSIKNNNGKTAFNLAYEKKNHAIVKALLLATKVDINKKDKFGRTLLQDSVVLGDNEMAKILIENGADINSKDNNGRNIIFDALSYGDENFISYLLSFKDLELNNIDVNGNSIMHHPQVKAHDNLAIMLIKAGADTTIQNRLGHTYLCDTALRGIEADHIVKLAINYGADINSKVANGNTILMELIHAQAKLPPTETKKKESLFEMAKKNISYGIDIDAVNRNGETVLFETLKTKDPKLLTYILEQGATIDLKNKHSHTPLHLMIYQGKEALELILILLKYGANPLIRDGNGKTIYEVLNDLILHTAKKKELTDPLMLSLVKQNGHYLELLKELLKINKQDLNFLDSNGSPLFFTPLLYDHFALFKLYIQNGLDIHKTDIENHNIFYKYVLKVFQDDKTNIDFQGILSSLLSKKVDQNFQDETGYTVVQKIMDTKCNTHLFDILTNVTPFDYSKTDKLGRSVIHTGVWYSKKDIIKRIHLKDPKAINIPDSYGILPITYAALLGAQELVLAFLDIGSNIASGRPISKAAIKKFKPMLKNLPNLLKDLEDDTTIQKVNMVIDQVKRDFSDH